MGTLIAKLSQKQRSFPIGLSGLTGMGYLLTGGISPLSRNQGLAIDQFLRVEGFWGSGSPFNLSKPNKSSTEKEKIEWKGLCGAAPFLGIVTKIRLKTQELNPLIVFQAAVDPCQLAICIQQAENWPNSGSLQWIWNEGITIYAIFEIDNYTSENKIQSIINKLPFSKKYFIKKIAGLYQLPPLEIPKKLKKGNSKCHCEVIGLLGTSWDFKSPEIINYFEKMMSIRPNLDCFIASQQLGGVVRTNIEIETSFIHRDSMWKPWISAAWPANDSKKREESLKWLETIWEKIKDTCPGIHLAQMHPHLRWHKKELNSAFGDSLIELKQIKSTTDPNNILPTL